MCQLEYVDQSLARSTPYLGLGPICSWSLQQNKSHHMLLNGAVYSVVHLMIEWDFKYILPQV